MPVSPDLPHQVFRQAVEQAALAISITDADANILYANPAFERVTGYREEQVLGRNQSMLSYKVTPGLVYESLWAQLRRQRAWNGMLVNRRSDGSRYLADLTITPVVDADGRTSHYLGMHRDVTEVHHLERKVQNQKALIESVVDVAQVSICLLDERDHVILDNQEYKKLIGDFGREPASILLTNLREQMGSAFDQARQHRQAIHHREVKVDLGGHRPARWFSCAISWFSEQDASADAFYEPGKRQYLLLTAQDISEIKRQQEVLRINTLSALLAEQERIQSLRETLAGAVYQLEGPLNTLTAAVRMLERRREGHGEETIDNAMEAALRDSRIALDTLRACIPVQRAESVRPLNLNEVLHDVLKMSTGALLAAGVVVEWSPAYELPVVTGGATQLAALFRQLLANAIEAINERRAGEQAHERVVRLYTLSYPDHVEVILEDSGPGIPAEWRYKAFEPFFTTKGAERGHLGMGLCMAQDTVARHGGLIDIDPEFHDGCRVRVQLPIGLAGDQI